MHGKLDRQTSESCIKSSCEIWETNSPKNRTIFTIFLLSMKRLGPIPGVVEWFAEEINMIMTSDAKKGKVCFATNGRNREFPRLGSNWQAQGNDVKDCRSFWLLAVCLGSKLGACSHASESPVFFFFFFFYSLSFRTQRTPTAIPALRHAALPRGRQRPLGLVVQGRHVVLWSRRCTNVVI